MTLKNRLLYLFLLLTVIGLYGKARADQRSLAGTVIAGSVQDVQPMDTIRDIKFATRVDSLYKYLTKEPNSTWDIVFRDGIRKPDLHTGDMLRVTYHDGTVKYYFLQLNPYLPSNNAWLGSITWPDMPNSFKGEVAQSYGWHGDTIPSFDSLQMNYVLILPRAYQKIPALTYSTCDLNASVFVKRAVSLEGTEAERTITFTVIAEDSITRNVYSVMLKKEQDTLAIEQKSIVTSRFYKVSEGNSLKETIKGLAIGTTVADFYSRITKVSELQTLSVISAVSGNELAETDIISLGDTLKVLSIDKTHITKYILEVTAEGLSSNALLTSSVYTVRVNGATGTISGFPVNTLLKTVLAGITIPAGATLTLVDQNDAYKSLVRLNYDTTYVDAQVSNVYFEVIAEDGMSRVLYQLLPDSRSRDAYVTSDLYSVDQYNIIIYPFRQGTSVASLLRDVTPARGATMMIMDKEGFVRFTGTLYKDDKLVVISEDGVTSKVYYFKTWSFITLPYLAYIISDEYPIDQIKHLIFGGTIGSSRIDFISKLIPSVGTTVKVMDATGNESTIPTLKVGDYVLVTSADGTQKIIYRIDRVCYDGVDTVDGALSISIFPNPTKGNVNIQGIINGSQLRVITPSGIVLYDRITDSLSQTISLDTQPAGVYLLIVSRDNKPIHVFRVVKQ